MNETDLKSFVGEIDDFIATMVTKYDADPLVASSIIMARLTLTNEMIGTDSEFRDLCQKIHDNPRTPLPFAYH